MATQVRVNAGAFNVLFPVAFGALAWGGLWLRSESVRRLVRAVVNGSAIL